MTLPESDTAKLPADSRTRLELFYRRFCEGRLRREYGLGHLLYACHAAFPLVLSPDLANLLYINFNHYPFYDGSTGNIAALASSDVLLSPLCRQISNRQFEMLPDIRSYLLNLLKDGRWFYRYGIVLKSEERLLELADFLQQYTVVKATGHGYEGTGFRRLNEWAALAYTNPGELARQIGKTLEEKSTDDQGQLWLNTQMDRLEKQYRFDVHNADGNGREALAPFFNLYHYSQARKSELFGKEQQAQIDANLIMNLPLSVKGGETISVPLAKNIAARTERRLNRVQRVVSLLVAIDDYKDHPLKGCVSSAQRLQQLLGQFSEKREDAFQSRIESGFDTKNVRTVFNEQATRQNIFANLTTLFNEANAEDICLVYFAGHGQNRSYHENTLMPVDFGLGNNPNLANSDFLKALEEAKRKTPCQVVLILDSHTGYYRWVGENDVFLGAVRHTMQTEVSVNETTESPFFHALTYILSHTKGAITYRHLLLWLRFLVKNMFPKSDETPVLMASIPNLDTYFLKADLRNADDAPVIAFNRDHQYWQVLPEDFKLVTINTTGHLRDYHTFENISGARGEVFVRENEMRFGGMTEGLNQDFLYRVDLQKPLLRVYCSENGPGGKTLKELVRNTGFGAFSKWRAIEYFPEDDVILNDDVERLVVGSVEEEYELSFGSTDKADKSDVRELAIGSTGLLKEAIEKFVRYHYFCNLHLPQDYDKLGDTLDVNFSIAWKGSATEKMPSYSEQLTISEEAFFISGDKINFYPLDLIIENEEAYPVFCSVYLTASNLAIKMIGSQTLHPIMPNTTARVIMDEPDFFERLLSQNLNGQLKLLVSRDPMQIDFSQSGFLYH